MAGPMWEVTGGFDTGGVQVWGGQALNSPKDEQRLLPGSLVKELRIEDNRIWFWRVAGYGPEYGWTDLKQGDIDMLEMTQKMPWDYKPPSALSEIQAKAREKSDHLKMAFPPPPNTHLNYYCVPFVDSKPSGLRASSCVNAMEKLREDWMDMADMSVASFADVTDPIVEFAFELTSQINKMGNEKELGIRYVHPQSKGTVLSWLRCEGQVGFPEFPQLVEEHNVYLLGKNKLSASKPVHLATGRFRKSFTDTLSGKPIEGAQSRQDFSMFWSRVRREFSSDQLTNPSIASYYPEHGKKFVPTCFAKVSWRFGFAYSDLSGAFYHARVPEVLWEVNKLAGKEFANLVEAEQDPQAVAASCPTAMVQYSEYDVLCFLDTDRFIAVYVFMKMGCSAAKDCVLATSALYEWEGIPKNAKTLGAEDVQIVSEEGRKDLIAFADGQAVKSSKLLDLSKCPKP